MKIHSTAKFEGFEIPIHNVFDVNIEAELIKQNVEQLTNISISKMKAKCESLNMNFSTMISFEVYFYHKNEEISIFKKEKTV